MMQFLALGSHAPIARPQGGARQRGCRAFAASAQRGVPPTTPHSGYHWDGSDRRFFEGWYWKVTDPKTGQSFAVIYSIEDPGARQQAGGSPLRLPLQTPVPSFEALLTGPRKELGGVGIQVMGLDDGYCCQFSRDTNAFWAEPGRLALGAALRAAPGASPARRMASPDQFFSTVDQGFQASAGHHQGRIIASETGAAGPPLSTVRDCSWSFEVLMSHGLASGWLQWGGRRLEFDAAPAYAEKNWGGGFPSKWIWIECNTFDGQPGLAVTAVGARRGLLGVPGLEEDVGMVGVHAGGQFIELVPWEGSVEWSVDPWGRWWVSARGGRHEAVVEATCDADAGTVLRAPTSQSGLAPHCKDTFFGRCRLRVWELGPGGRRAGEPIVDATSTTAALEVGGGPWWATWQATAEMREPFKSLVKLPIDVAGLARATPSVLRPPGL